MTMKEVLLSPGVLRLIKDIEEAYDQDAFGMADMLGLSINKLDDHLHELRDAIEAGKDVNVTVTRTTTTVMN
jgi:hypothetical protein